MLTRGPSATTLTWMYSYEVYMASEKKIFECFFPENLDFW